MKFFILALSFLAVVYCSSSDDNQNNYRKYDGQQVEEKSYPTVEYPPQDPEVSPQTVPSPAPASAIRLRRSPPRFDPRKMKGKIEEESRKKRDVDIGKIFRRVQDRLGGF